MGFLLLETEVPTAIVDSTLKTVINTEAIKSGDYQGFMNTLFTKGSELIISFGSKILLAILVFFVGKWILNKLKSLFKKMLDKKNVDVSLSSFLNSLVSVILSFILIITIISILGIETSSFVALFASAGVAIGMALSGTLQNFAGGVMILLFKPFKVGDFIEAQGFVGTVKEIQIFNTILNTLDNKVIIIPNGGLSTGSITNYSKEEIRRVDWIINIAYGDDFDKAKSVMKNLIESDNRILKTPEPFIALNSLGQCSIEIVVRCWVSSADYWGVYFDMNENVYKSFPKSGLNLPFPQMEVHISQ